MQSNAFLRKGIEMGVDGREGRGRAGQDRENEAMSEQRESEECRRENEGITGKERRGREGRNSRVDIPLDSQQIATKDFSLVFIPTGYTDQQNKSLPNLTSENWLKLSYFQDGRRRVSKYLKQL